MNILCVNDSGLQGGGAETRIRLLLESLAAEKDVTSIVFLCLEDTSVTGSEILQKKLTVVNINGNWRTERKLWVKILKTYSIDIVQIHNALGLSPKIVRYAKLNHIPVVWFAHDYWPICAYRSMVDVKINARSHCKGPSFINCVKCVGLKSYARLKLFRKWMSGVDIAIAPAQRFQDTCENLGFLNQKMAGD